MIKLRFKSLIAITLATLLLSTPVLAYLYQAPFTIIESDGVAYDMLPARTSVNSTWMADNGFMKSTALDTRVETLGGLAKPHMVADDKILTAIPVPADSQTNLYFSTGNTDLPAMDIITGYDGYLTVNDVENLELGADFEVEVDGWVDTDAGADKNLVYKEDAFWIAVSDTEEIQGVIYNYIDPIEVTPAIAGSWQDVDVSAYCPLGITGVVLHLYSLNGEILNVRKNGSADNRLTDVDRHGWAMVGVDGDRKFQAYSEVVARCRVFLVGYVSTGYTFKTNADDISLGAGFGAWTEIDLTAQTSADTIGVVIEVENVNAVGGRVVGFRKEGSTDNRTNSLTFDSRFWVIIGCDNSQKIRHWAEDGEINAYLVGYIEDTSDAVFATNATDKSLPGIAAYADIDCSAEAPNADFLIFEVVSTGNFQYALREKGSAEDLYQLIMQHFFAIVKCDENQMVEGKIGNVGVDFFLVGYITGGVELPDVRKVTATGVGSDEHVVTVQTNDEWDYRLELTLDNADVDAALSDFPILVYLSANSGRNGDDVSCVFDELTLDANRKKIAITTSDETTQCYVEIEKWDDAAEQAWLWVKVPDVASATDTILYLYYDKDHADNDTYVGDTNSTPAEKVWEDDGYFVTHMKDDPDNAHIRDSSVYSSDGTKVGANRPIEGAGVATAYLQDFNAVNPDYITIAADQTQLDFTSEDFSLIVRVNCDSLASVPYIFIRGDGGVEGYALNIRNTGQVQVWTAQTPGANQFTTSAVGEILIANWYTLGFSRDGASVSIYKNGADITANPGVHIDPTTSARSAKIGIHENVISDQFDGKMEFLGVFGGVALTPAFHKAFDQSIIDDFVAYSAEGSGHLLEILVDTVSKDGASLGAGVPANNNDYIVGQNNVLPYINTITIDVGGIEILEFLPANMIHADIEGVRETADAGSTTTLDDAFLVEADDYWNDYVLQIITTTDGLAPQGEIRTVTGFDAANDRLTFGAMTDTVDANDTYELRSFVIVDETPDSGTADAGTVATLTDAVLVEAIDYWNGATLYIVTTTDGLAPQGEYTTVDDFAATVLDFTLFPLSVAPGAGDTYVLRNDGHITWGVNPSGVAASLGSMVSSGQAGVGVVVEDVPSSVLPPAEVSDWFGDGTVTKPSTLANPIRPFITMASDNTTLTEILVWRLMGLALLLFVTVAVGRLLRGHVGITIIVASGTLGGLVAFDNNIFPLYLLVLAVGMFVGGLVAERSPSV